MFTSKTLPSNRPVTSTFGANTTRIVSQVIKVTFICPIPSELHIKSWDIEILGPDQHKEHLHSHTYTHYTLESITGSDSVSVPKLESAEIPEIPEPQIEMALSESLQTIESGNHLCYSLLGKLQIKAWDFGERRVNYRFDMNE